MKFINAALLTLCLSSPLLPTNAIAGFDEGLAAAKNGDFVTALFELKPLAEQGNAQAQFILARMHETGQGVAQDYKETVKWYRLAADQGYAEAQSNLGWMYEMGQGVAKDYKEALKWYRLAADQGDAKAQSNLGVMYSTGQGVAQDYKEALKWNRLAADQGYVGQFNLGLMYKNGQGVAKSRVIAFAMFNLSGANFPSSENQATANRADLAQSMSTKEIEAAQDLTRELSKPKNFLKALDQYSKKPSIKK